ncbi:MAG: hypothetical protein GC165_16020 [Armatimonadetes bacterium]|nr:hypothetical protein [Armatimonadota bacterium]
MKLRPLLLLAALALAGYGGYRWVEYQRIAKIKKEADAYDRDFLQGRVEPLPGPYLEIGNIFELQFQVMELPGKIVRLLPNGSMLTQDDRTWTVLDRDGHIQQSITAEKVFLTSDGKTYSFTQGSPSSQAITMTKPDGVKQSIDDSTKAWNYATSPGYHIGEHGFYLGGIDSPGQIVFDDFDLKPHSAAGSKNLRFQFCGSSEELGDVGIGQPTSPYEKKYLVFFKGQDLSIEDTHLPTGFLDVVVSGSTIAINCGRAFQERIPYQRTAAGQYLRLAVPTGAVTASVTAINSKGIHILNSWSPSPVEARKPGQLMPYWSYLYYVVGNRCYDLREIYTTLFGSLPSLDRVIETDKIDEQGDIVATTDRGTFLLKPIPHVDP